MTSKPWASSMTKGRTRYSFAIQFSSEGEWNRSEIGSPDLHRVVNHMAEAAEQNAKVGFFPAFKIIRLNPEGVKEFEDAI